MSADAARSGHPESVPPGDAAGVVGPVVRDLTARRLARASIPLATLLALGALGLVLDPAPVWAGVVAGAPVAAVALVALGMRGVDRAVGAEGRGWAAVPGFVWVVPWGYGVFVLGWPGLLLLRDALAAGAPLQGAAGVASSLLGLQVLRTSARVGEVARLGGVMGGGGIA